MSPEGKDLEQSVGEQAPPVEDLSETHEGLKERLATLIQTISSKPKLEVRTEVDPRTVMEMAREGQDANKAWFRQVELDPSTGKPIREWVHIPAQILETSENVAKGKAAHEAGHVIVTRYSEFIPDKVLQNLGFQSLMAAIEERPTDQVVREYYPGAGKWVDEARQDSVRESLSGLEEKVKSISPDSKPPKFAQLCSLLVYEPHLTDEVRKEHDQEVLDLYEKIRPHVELVEKTLPKEGASEEEIQAAAQERYKIVYSKIWPEARGLVEKDIKQEKQKQAEKNPSLKGKALEKVVRQILEMIEDMIVQEISAQLLGHFAETHKNFKERKVAEEKAHEAEHKRDKVAEELEEYEKQEAIRSANKNPYEKAYEEMRESEQELYQRLEEIFTPNIKREVQLRSSGSRINLPAIFKREAQKGAGAPEVTNKIFESVRLPEKKDYSITLLVDLSGSMNGENKIQETFKAVVVMGEVLNRLGIRFEILGFQDEIIPFKKFNEELDDTIRSKINGMPLEVRDRNPDGHNQRGYNDDGPSLLEASGELEQEPSREKFLIVLSDGQPAGRRSTAKDLTNAVTQIQSNTDQKLIALGLGQGTEHVKQFYPASIANIAAKDLPEVLGNLLEDIIKNPARYSSSTP